MFSWFKRLFGWFKRKPPRVEPESRWVVAVDAAQISVRDDAGVTRSITKDELRAVIVETNDTGPWGADVWWRFFQASGEQNCAFPQGATGEEAVIDYLLGLPAFDHGAMISAMTSTDNAIFIVWQMPAA